MTGGDAVGLPPVGREPVGATVVVELPPVGAIVLVAETVGSAEVAVDSLLLVVGAAVSVLAEEEVLEHFSATNFEVPVFTKKSDT